MNVSPDRVVQLVREGLAPVLAADPSTLELAIELARDIVVYGERAMPRAMFTKKSGLDVAAAVCEDFEGAAAIESWLDGPCVEISHGWGLVSVILAERHPGRTFETVQTDRDRKWYLQRLCALWGIRNLELHEQEPAEFVAEHREGYDLVCVKGLGPNQALDLVAPLLSDRGRLLTWQTSDRSAEVRRPRTDHRGEALRLEQSIALRSAPAHGRVILCVRSATPVLDAALPTA